LSDVEIGDELMTLLSAALGLDVPRPRCAQLSCETVPGKRASTVETCESSGEYVPFNDSYNWKGDPNATLSGQGVPQYRPGAAPRVAPPTAASPALAVAAYDPATGEYIGPDGRNRC
jgi:phospholipid/cholesterol/gamma-HCH transport system substrate-binding protein